MKNSHRFQTSHAIDAYSAARDLWDTPLFESKSFIALPTVGTLVEGWLLVVPKVPAISFAQVSKALFSELDQFINEVVHVVALNYGPVAVFEHGPCTKKSKVGCGVDYAHLHLVPTRCDLLAGAKQVAPNIQWNSIESLSEIQNYANDVEGYWFLQQSFGSGICHMGKCEYGEPTSQLFRRVIANYIGRPSAFDWKHSMGEDKIAATVASLSSARLLLT
ncbi:MAG: hypothetical protein JWR26_3052 [Pedosphaera sp.]|nr:hypothetical protein [Pedosphaera sp.]